MCGSRGERRCVGLGHDIVHVADNVRHAVAVHRRGLEQIGIGVAALTATAATAGGASPLLASIAIGAAASTASYAAGCVGVSGSRGCSAKGAASVGAVGAGLAGAGNAFVGGTVGTSVTARVAQYSSVGIASSAVAGGAGLLAESDWENSPVTGGGLWGAGLGSLGGIADRG